MTLDLDAIAREAGYKHPDAVGACEDFEYFDLNRFAALLLEKAAQVCDGQVERWTDDRARYCASECAAGIRSMAAGMGE